MKILFILGLVFCHTVSVSYGQQSNRSFSNTVKTTAKPETVWNIWTDVNQWHQWDVGLKSAELKGNFQKGAKGSLVTASGSKSSFIVLEYAEGKGYTIASPIPLGKLMIERSLVIEGDSTVFTHKVYFTGPFKHLFGAILGKKFRPMLPLAMEKIKQMAESGK